MPAPQSRPTKPAAPRQSPPAVVITAVPGGFATVSPGPHLDVVKRELTASRSVAEPGGRRGYARRREREYFYDEAGGQFVIFAGHMARVGRAIENAGYAVILRESPAGVGVPEFAQGLAGAASGMAAALTSTGRARLSYSGAAERADLVAGVCLVVPDDRVMVAARNRAEGRDLVRRLESRVGGVFGTADWRFEEHQRVLVTSFRKAGFALGTDWELLIADAECAAAAGARQDLWRFAGAGALVGLQPRSFAPSRRQELFLGALFGPTLNLGVAAPKAEVHWAVPPSLPPTPPALNALERKREAHWHNDAWNGYAASVALAAASPQGGDLDRLGLARLADSLSPMDRPPRVLALCESPEHAVELARHLPGWPLVALDTPAPAARPAAPGAIVTLAAAGRNDLGAFGVVVHCGAGLTPAAVPVPALQWPSSAATAVVDFADDRDAQAKREARARLDAYRLRGWTTAAGPQWLRAA